MAKPQMWMCAGRFGAWVPCPDSPLTRSRAGVMTETRLLNGGSYVTAPQANRAEFSPSWRGSGVELQPIKDFYDGLYGPGPFYFVDPAATRNVFPPGWAAPQLSGIENWPSLVRGVVPTLTTTVVSATLTPPPQQATYALPATAPVFDVRTPRITLAVPPGFNLNLRLWGSRTGTAVIRTNSYNRTTGAVTTADVVPTSTGATFTASGNSVSHVELWITKTSTATSTITLAAMLGVVNAATTVPPTSWFSGQGNSGVRFNGDLSTSVYYTWGEGREVLTGQLIEVGSWLQ